MEARTVAVQLAADQTKNTKPSVVLGTTAASAARMNSIYTAAFCLQGAAMQAVKFKIGTTRVHLLGSIAGAVIQDRPGADQLDEDSASWQRFLRQVTLTDS